MDVFRRRNGELTAVVVSTACAWFLAESFFDHLDEYDPFQMRFYVAIAATATTWVFWRLLVSRARRYRLVRGTLSGVVSGALMHPVYMIALTWSGALDGELHGEYIFVALFHMIGFAFFLIQLTILLGGAIGALAVLIGRPPPPQEDRRPASVAVRKPY